jgi:hypothetical protein
MNLHVDHGFWGWLLFIVAAMSGIISIFLLLDLLSSAVRPTNVTWARLLKNLCLIIAFGLLSYWLFFPVLGVDFK